MGTPPRHASAAAIIDTCRHMLKAKLLGPAPVATCCVASGSNTGMGMEDTLR